jgi:hypothetical protein
MGGGFPGERHPILRQGPGQVLAWARSLYGTDASLNKWHLDAVSVRKHFKRNIYYHANRA